MAKATRFLAFIELKYTELSNQIETWLRGEFRKSGVNYNSASPFGQILNVNKELFQHNVIYLKNALNQLDIENSNNEKVILMGARFAGHNPSRAISATGTLKFKLKPGVKIDEEIKDSIIIINNRFLLKNISNGLEYSINLTTDRNIYPITTNCEFFVPIIQGKYESERFTGKGEFNQTFSVNVPNLKKIENWNFTIKYNGVTLPVKDHLFDILKDERACWVRTGFNGGLDIHFGNQNNGFIPIINSVSTLR